MSKLSKIFGESGGKFRNWIRIMWLIAIGGVLAAVDFFMILEGSDLTDF